jgi:hypothetical protein
LGRVDDEQLRCADGVVHAERCERERQPLVDELGRACKNRGCEVERTHEQAFGEQ